MEILHCIDNRNNYNDLLATEKGIVPINLKVLCTNMRIQHLCISYIT